MLRFEPIFLEPALLSDVGCEHNGVNGMTYHPNNARIATARRPVRRDYARLWVVAALAAVVALGLIFWLMNGDRHTASTTSDMNTGASTSAQITTPTPAPAAPSRP